MRPFILSFATLLCVGTLGCATVKPKAELQYNQEPRSFSRTITQEEKLNYLLFLPNDYDAEGQDGWPLILFLHGAGERGSDIWRAAVHGPPKLVKNDPDFPFIVVSPQCPADQVWENSPLVGLLDEVVSLYNVDTNRVYLTGLSMGGYGSWSLGLAYPERFAAMAPICGGGERITVALGMRGKEKALRSLPIWAFHGAKDPVVPLEESQRMVDAVKRAGVKEVTLTVYPEADHDSWTETYNNPELYEWFLQHRR